MNIFKTLFGTKRSNPVVNSPSKEDEDLEAVEILFQEKKVQAIHLAHNTGFKSLSKLGGQPDVDPSFQWPSWKGRPMSFLAQIDLSSLPRLSGFDKLPASGLLSFFYDQEQSTWGFDPNDLGSWKVIFHENTQSLSRAELPPELPSESIFREFPLSASIRTTYPSLERIGIDCRAYPREVFDIEDNLRQKSRPEGPEHQIGGYPNPVQGDTMELEAQLASNGLYCGDSTGYKDPKASALAPGSKDWLLLMQVDTDETAGMMWGDCGMLYFWLRIQDL